MTHPKMCIISHKRYHNFALSFLLHVIIWHFSLATSLFFSVPWKSYWRTVDILKEGRKEPDGNLDVMSRDISFMSVKLPSAILDADLAGVKSRPNLDMWTMLNACFTVTKPVSYACKDDPTATKQTTVQKLQGPSWGHRDIFRKGCNNYWSASNVTELLNARLIMTFSKKICIMSNLNAETFHIGQCETLNCSALSPVLTVWELGTGQTTEASFTIPWHLPHPEHCVGGDDAAVR